MQYAVFFRNLNLGRPNCPTKAQLEQAFLDAGAVTAQSFLTNGTIVIRKVGNTPGSPNAFLEKHLDLPATTRNWNTVVRLVQKHA